MAANSGRPIAVQYRRDVAHGVNARPECRHRMRGAGSDRRITASVTLESARDLLIDALTFFHMARVALASDQGTTTMLR